MSTLLLAPEETPQHWGERPGGSFLTGPSPFCKAALQDKYGEPHSLDSEVGMVGQGQAGMKGPGLQGLGAPQWQGARPVGRAAAGQVFLCGASAQCPLEFCLEGLLHSPITAYDTLEIPLYLKFLLPFQEALEP